ncbi:bacterio-opsin activator domain-containing protein [Haladaptatus salinisoli]|uniref:bacterio-opsin activator domain-containing protein n=1 Tax=Haladaptatus salinisoli TaxID=2884876 RepID=UPI001D0BA65F|nr:bacterio-opsin activator domain-containing protein [Haladaptatus salinisoli]
MPLPSGSDDSNSRPHEGTETLTEDAFFEQLVHNALDGLLTLDDTATICFANEAASDIFGYDIDELVGRSVDDLFPEQYRDEYLAELHQYMHDAETVVEHTDLERVGRCKDGTDVPLSFSLREHAYRDQSLYTAVLRDISDQKRQREQLNAAREKYQTLVEAAPDAIFVADAETGVIQEANHAAAELLGKPTDEIEGMHQIDLHPSEEADRYEQLFRGHRQRGGLFAQNDDLKVVTADGQHIPVAINSNVTTLQDRRVIQGIFRDISDQKRREDALQSLHTTTQRMLATSSRQEICTEAVQTATDVLELPITGLHLSLEDETALEPVATSEAVTTIFDGSPPTVTPEDTLIWDVFETGNSQVIPDLQDIDEHQSQETPIRSAIITSLGAHGVLITASTSVYDFDRIDYGLMRVLAANTEAALTRAERERAVARQRDELETVNRLNAIIRDINQTLVAAPTREEIERTVCERFAASDSYLGALIGDLSSAERGLNLRTAAGIDDSYLHTVDAAAPATEQGSAATTLETGTLTVVEDIATSNAFPDAVREDALACGYRAAACIPLGYGNTTYGVLVVYAPAPEVVGELEQAVFAELGETIGHAINATENKKLLHTDQILELEFSLGETDAFFFTVSDELSCTITLDGAVPSSDGTLLFYVTATDVAPDQLLERAQAASRVDQARLIAETGADSSFEFVFQSAETASQLLIERGAYIQSGMASHGEGTLTIEVPADVDVRSFVEAVQDIYPAASLHAKRQRTRPVHSRTSFLNELETALTDRQLEILQMSFHSGYFEYPRVSTGETLANTLDIASPTFHQHMQTALHKLLTTLFSGDSESRRR